ncbi:tyrosine--tRNA ligase [Patescibacteria group bacterium]|nr:MAG: tyrosine--tRNA ligase [Patescibacteria group bacterium]
MGYLSKRRYVAMIIHMKNELESKIDELLSRGVSEVIDKDNLKKRLLAGEKLRIKLGIDPTSPNLHLGRSVVLLKLKDFQDLGHQIVFIIGDFTGVIGDASDKESERPMLAEETVEQNLQTYREQAGKILDMEKVEFHRNSEWLGKLTYKEIAKQANAFSVAEFIARENVAKRLEKGSRVSLREVLYPLMQGYDSVAVRADVELGGTDQRFNLLAGRDLQRAYEQESQDILTVNLIEGIDGRKMSSSWGNTINLLDEPNEMFGKVMSMGDELIIKYFVHCTRVPLAEVEKMQKEMEGGVNPRDLKIKLASEIVKIYHGPDKANEAEQYFIQTFSRKEVPTDMPVQVVKWVEAYDDHENVMDFMVSAGLAMSRSDARRKIEQGGVTIDGEKVVAGELILTPQLHDGKVLKVGKIHFVKIKFEK